MQGTVYVLYHTPFSINPPGGPNNSSWLDFRGVGVPKILEILKF